MAKYKNRLVDNLAVNIKQLMDTTMPLLDQMSGQLDDVLKNAEAPSKEQEAEIEKLMKNKLKEFEDLKAKVESLTKIK